MLLNAINIVSNVAIIIPHASCIFINVFTLSQLNCFIMQVQAYMALAGKVLAQLKTVPGIR